MTKMTMEEACSAWYNSKTKKYLEDNDLDYVAGTRCYWELGLELKNDRRWLKEPFHI